MTLGETFTPEKELELTWLGNMFLKPATQEKQVLGSYAQEMPWHFCLTAFKFGESSDVISVSNDFEFPFLAL